MRRPPRERVTVRAPAKLNLHLSVGRQRRDGFHELTTVFHAIGLYDEVEAVAADKLSVTVVGEGAADVPLDGSNLAIRAAALLGLETGHEPNVALTITKGIPVAGGCAGGSADAAAALVACDALWATGLSRDDLSALGARLGSDVPFSLHGGTALGTGRGELLTPVLGQGSYAWVLALADEGLSTPDVYAELDRQRETGPVAVVSDPAEVMAALRTGDAEALGHAMCNDLQPAAVGLRPALSILLEAGIGLGALGAIVSGSGPTIAFLARNDEHGGGLASALTGQPGCRSVRTAEGPVPGARVVESL